MPYSLILQYPYDTIQIALCQNGNIIRSAVFHKFDATSKTIPTIIQLLNAQNLKLSDISFFGINIGPGPYNTLRAVLTMINGIKRVTQIPLVTINALDLLQKEIDQENSLIILNAFENHVFYKIKTGLNQEQAACSLADLEKIVEKQKNYLTVQGNGAIKYQVQLKTWKNITWPQEIIPFNKLETLAVASFEKFKRHEYNDQYLKPVYFEDLVNRL
jgi:tRNA threonylcarbamoyl adenosine modification protein YeaZ